MRRAVQFLIVILVGALLCASPEDHWITVDAQSAFKLNEAERALVAGSRTAIVRTGMTPAYFDRHFTLVKVVNQPGDRRVVWKFSVNEYSTNVADVLGYYTAHGKRIDTHSVTTTLRATSDITRTISRPKANQIMQQCIGNFRNASIEYRVSDANSAGLFLTAESVPKVTRQTEERHEREERERQAKPKPSSGSDPVEEEEGDDGPPITVGSVNLQTGKCTKGQLMAAP